MNAILFYFFIIIIFKKSKIKNQKIKKSKTIRYLKEILFRRDSGSRISYGCMYSDIYVCGV